jgi:hypothetical protein
MYVENGPAFYAAKNASVWKHGCAVLQDLPQRSVRSGARFKRFIPIWCPVEKIHTNPMPGCKVKQLIPMVPCGCLNTKLRCMSKMVPCFMLQQMRPFQNVDVLKPCTPNCYSSELIEPFESPMWNMAFTNRGFEDQMEKRSLKQNWDETHNAIKPWNVQKCCVAQTLLSKKSDPVIKQERSTTPTENIQAQSFISEREAQIRNII